MICIGKNISGSQPQVGPRKVSFALGRDRTWKQSHWTKESQERRHGMEKIFLLCRSLVVFCPPLQTEDTKQRENVVWSYPKGLTKFRICNSSCKICWQLPESLGPLVEICARNIDVWVLREQHNAMEHTKNWTECETKSKMFIELFLLRLISFGALIFQPIAILRSYQIYWQLNQ